MIFFAAIVFFSLSALLRSSSFSN